MAIVSCGFCVVQFTKRVGTKNKNKQKNILPYGKFAIIGLQFAIDFVFLFDGAFSGLAVFIFRMNVEQIFQVGWNKLALDIVMVTGMCDADDVLAVEIRLECNKRNIIF